MTAFIDTGNCDYDTYHHEHLDLSNASVTDGNIGCRKALSAPSLPRMTLEKKAKQRAAPPHNHLEEMWCSGSVVVCVGGKETDT